MIIKNRPGSRASYAIAIALFSIASAFPVTSEAAIIARFADGNGTTQVDQFTGIAGDGWLGEWKRQFNTSVNTSETTVRTPASSGYAPLVDNENYLAIRFRKGAAAVPTAGASISRQYGNGQGIVLNEEHTVSFYYRVDTALDQFDRLAIWGTTTATIAPNDRVTWLADVSTSETWQFLDNTETGRIDSGLAVKAGNIYHFEFTLDPESNTYGVSLKDLTDGGEYTSDSQFRFRYKSNSAGGVLAFGAAPIHNPAGTVQVDFAVSNIAITAIPESGTSAMMLGGGAVLAWFGRRHLAEFAGGSRR